MTFELNALDIITLIINNTEMTHELNASDTIHSFPAQITCEWNIPSLNEIIHL